MNQNRALIAITDCFLGGSMFYLVNRLRMINDDVDSLVKRKRMVYK